MSRGTQVFLRTTGTPPPGASIGQRFEACVRNTGNYFYEESLLRHLPDLQVCGSVDALPRCVGTLVLSMSNFISPVTDLGYLARELERRRVGQVVMIGAGAQAYEYGERIRLTPGTRRFLDFVAGHSRSIGVRGHHTADVLDRMGIRNVEVIGCPSAFWQGRAPRLDGAGSLPPCPRLAVHSTPLGHYRDKVSALMAHGMRHGADYILQSEAWMMPLLTQGDGADAGTGDGGPALLHENLLFYAYPECDPARLRTWLERRLLVFFGMAQWLDRIGTYDFVYGSRFHGNMAALQAGVPALNMPFDTRTRELCEYLNLPTLPLEDFNAGVPLGRLRELADFSLYNRTYGDRLVAYKAFLSGNGLAHALDSPAPPPQSPPSPEWQVKLSSLRRLVADLERHGGGCASDGLHAAFAQRLHCDRDARARAAAEEGRLDHIWPHPGPAAGWPAQTPAPRVAAPDADALSIAATLALPGHF